MTDRDQTLPLRPGALDPLRHPTFRAVWLASLASNLGGMIQLVGASWLMTDLTSSATFVALVQTSASLPIMLLSLPSGAMADSLDRRRIMLAAQSLMLSASVALVVLAWAELITPWFLLALTCLVGVGKALNAPAWQASVGDIVTREQLPEAVALNSMGFNIARSVGPALGGAIVTALGAASAFALNAISYLGLIAVLLRWQPVRTPPDLPRERLGAAMLAGVRYVALSPAVRIVLLRALVFGLGASGVQALLPLVAQELLGGGALTYGLLLGAFGVGAVAGALSGAFLRSRASTETLVRAAALASAIGSVAVALSQNLWLTQFALLLAGAGWVLALSSFNVTVQLEAPRWVVGRALSLYQMANFGGMAGGSWLWGTVAERTDVPMALLASAGVLVTCALIGLRLPLESGAVRDMAPLRRWAAPTTAFPVSLNSGPVVVGIDWRIAEPDIPEFLHLMTERRRIRRRDGAHHWVLLRDIADAELWVERYHAPTWTDYVRLNNRLTRDDAAILDRLKALHQGEDSPFVRRLVEQEPQARVASRAATARELATPLTDPTRVA